MAKNLFQTKKRVSHFQKTHEGLEGENELFGCKDYVSSIIQGMDSNFSYIQGGYSKRGVDSTEIQSTTFEDSFSNIPILHIPESSDERTLQNSGKNSKIKKFSLSKKFPLMEKSQKILKQLKHNQNIPKPRAHLAALPKSPAKCKPKAKSKIPVSKRKEIDCEKSKALSNPCRKLPSNHSTAVNVKKSSDLSKITKDGLVTKCKTNKLKDKNSGKSSIRGNELNSITNSEVDIDSGTSDSEFEKFLMKNKDLSQKSIKKQKQNSKKSKSCTKSLKRKKHVSEPKKTYNHDVTELSRNSKISPFKKPKIVHTLADFTDSDCSNHDVPDLPIRDSSSESDDNEVCSTTQRATLNTCETEILSTDNSFQSYTNLTVQESNNFELEGTEVDNSMFGVKSIGETESISDAHSSLLCQNLQDLKSNIDPDQMQSEFLSETSVNSIKIEQDSLTSNIVIDLCDSDDECNNVELNTSTSEIINNGNMSSIEKKAKSSADPDSEESDLEILEVIKPFQTIDKCSPSMLANVVDSVNVANSGNQLVLEDVCVDVKPSIKTENLDSKSILNILPVVKSQTETKSVKKHDVNTVVSNHDSKLQNVPSEVSFPANLDPAAVKHEFGSDDSDIIIDSVHSTKVIDASNLSSAEIVNIKSEPSTSENQFKLIDTVEDNNEWGKNFQDVIQVSSTDLLELYKMEFETYKEMKQANADVEASLKTLQARQYQKMFLVRNLLYKCVQSNENTKPLTVKQEENLKDSKNIIPLNVQNNLNVSPNNSASPNPQNERSLSSEDVKPGINKLEEEMQPVAIKQEVKTDQDNVDSKKNIPKIESDYKQTLKLFDEKCSACGKNAIAACQRCAKVFFCSHECGRKFWIDGHVKVCGTK